MFYIKQASRTAPCTYSSIQTPSSVTDVGEQAHSLLSHLPGSTRRFPQLLREIIHLPIPQCFGVNALMSLIILSSVHRTQGFTHARQVFY